VNRHRGFVEELLREVDAARQRHVERRGTDVLEKQTTEVAGGDAQPVREPVYSVIVQRTLTDEPECA
jgi:hypothetical protein